MTKTRRATNVTKKVKDRVYERDNGVCILCGSEYGRPECHYIPRSHLGMGIEENIVTLCPECHRAFDQSTRRKEIKEKIRDYLSSRYTNWNEASLVYSKYAF